MQLEGKKVVIVGAGSGIGRSLASAASEAGATVVLAGRRKETLDFTGALLRGPWQSYPLDAAAEEGVAAFFQAVGRFDHLVSTASQGIAGPIAKLDAEAIGRAFTAKLWAPIFLVKHGAPWIAADGSFTFFSGIRAARPAAGTSITSLVNGGLEAFARAMAVELGPVRVNVISPGIVDSGPFWERLGPEGREKLFTDFAQKSPARRVGQPEDIAAAALFAIANPFLTGTVLAVDGGGLLM
ncbi:MAG TPA: SDR family oxidoreductase [Thermoanaerobaculia bacterium]|jgi:NAD(P)-dependent dehydrogenase (short-subunit alcohol dehydrogenase family)|nr:SDR family oxidoreductase [Thermoanaerobaculia bacterium]